MIAKNFSNINSSTEFMPFQLLSSYSSEEGWYDTGSSDSGSTSTDEQIEITLDERAGIWTGKKD